METPANAAEMDARINSERKELSRLAADGYDVDRLSASLQRIAALQGAYVILCMDDAARRNGLDKAGRLAHVVKMVTNGPDDESGVHVEVRRAHHRGRLAAIDALVKGWDYPNL